MPQNKIYPPFLRKINSNFEIKNQTSLSGKIFEQKKGNHEVIVSFTDKELKDKFVQDYHKKNILDFFEIIPSVKLNLTKEQIVEISNSGLVKTIEEDQHLFLCSEDLIEDLGILDYRSSQIVYSGNNVRIGIIDDALNDELEYISEVIIPRNDSKNKIIGEEKQKISKELITHGSLVAGIIVNQSKYKNQPICIAPGAKILDLSPKSNNGHVRISDLLNVFDELVQNNTILDIILISFNTIAPSDGSDILSLACNKMVERGVVIITPAGNFGPEAETIGSPGAAEKVITVGALTRKNTIAYYSGRGPTLDGRNKPDFCLPGSKIFVSLNKNNSIKFTGTSAAAAIATGIIALLKEYNKEISPEEILDSIRNSCSDIGFDDNSQGCGTSSIVRLFKSLNLYQEKTISYIQLLNISFKFTVRIILLLIFIFYLRFIITIFQV